MTQKKSYIISGISRSGKSQLCSRIHNELGYSWIECDFLIFALQHRYKNLGISHEVDWKLGSKRFTQLANHYFESLLHNPDNKLVVDSYHIHPKYLDQKVKDRYEVMFISYPNADTEEKVNAIQAYDLVHHGWTEDFSREEITKWVISWIEQSKELESSCKKYGYEFVDVSVNYERKMEELYDRLAN